MSRQFSGKARKIAVPRRKGGLGTTTTTIALATGLAMRGYEVLFLEGDDNRRASRILLGADSADGRPIQDAQTTYNLFTHPEEGLGRSDFQVHLERLVGEIPGAHGDLMRRRGWNPTALRIVPGSRALRKLESNYLMATASRASAEFDPYTQLSKAIARFERDFDFIIIDTPSMLSLVTTNEVMAADYALFIADFDPDSPADFQEAAEFFRTAQGHCRQLNLPVPQPLGVVYNKYRPGRKRHQTLLEAYTKEHYAGPKDDRRIPALIPYPQLGLFPFSDEVLEDAMERRRPVHLTAPESDLGEAMYVFTNVVEHAVNVAAASGR